MMKTKEYFMERMYKASAGMSNAVLVTLGMGLLLESIGKAFGWDVLVQIGGVAKVLLAPAFGAGIAYQLGGNTLVIFSAMVCSTIGGTRCMQRMLEWCLFPDNQSAQY